MTFLQVWESSYLYFLLNEHLSPLPTKSLFFVKEDDIITILITYIKKEFARDSQVEITAQTDLFASGILDSLGLMKLIRFVEATFDNPVPLTDILPENFSSVRNISQYLTNA